MKIPRKHCAPGISCQADKIIRIRYLLIIEQLRSLSEKTRTLSNTSKSPLTAYYFSQPRRELPCFG